MSYNPDDGEKVCSCQSPQTLPTLTLMDYYKQALTWAGDDVCLAEVSLLRFLALGLKCTIGFHLSESLPLIYDKTKFKRFQNKDF